MRELLLFVQAQFARAFAAVGAAAHGIARLIARAGRGSRALIVRAWRGAFVRRALAFAASSARVALGTIIATSLLVGCGWMLFQRVPPGSIGVREKSLGSGIEARDYRAGIYFSPRGFETWHLVETRTQVLDFAWESEGGEHPMLQVRTRDGNAFHAGVTVLHRVRDGEAHLLVKDGLRSVWKQRVRSTVEKVVLEEFGNLSTAELSETDVRLARCESALKVLNGLLRAYHVEAERLLVTSFYYANEYEKKLQEKQHTAQETLMSAALLDLEIQRHTNEAFELEIDGSEKTIRAELDMQIQRRYAEGRKRIVELDTEAKEYDRLRQAQSKAEYDRLVAEGEQLVARAALLEEVLYDELWDSPAGRILLARRAAENLNLQTVTLNSNDPRVPSFLDLDELVVLLLGSAP